MANRKIEDFNDAPFETTGQTIEENPQKKKQKEKEVNKKELETLAEPYAIRDAHYAALLGEYKDEFKDRRAQTYKMRNALFWVMLVLLCGITLACFIGLFIVIKNFTYTVTDIVALSTIGLSFISSLIAIPLAITKSLFPEKENDQIVGVLTKLIENDINIRTQNNEIAKTLKNVSEILKDMKKDD